VTFKTQGVIGEGGHEKKDPEKGRERASESLRLKNSSAVEEDVGALEKSRRGSGKRGEREVGTTGYEGPDLAESTGPMTLRTVRQSEGQSGFESRGKRKAFVKE